MRIERVFVDTNVLLAATVPARADHARATDVLRGAVSSGLRLFASGQVLREYLAVCTRPIAANGLALTPVQAAANAERLAERLDLLAEDDAVARRLRALVRKYEVRGRQVHDANLVATALAHGLTDILTANAADFARFRDEVAVHAVCAWAPRAG
jgi:predicted nucleic acid-binding protein